MKFVGCMFLGYGIGLLFGHSHEGAVIGMGIGFLVNSYFDKN
tara:strand:- start:1208 stop:1333 length:126 start_codon:yes stop_codon:yes gene_type:complete